MTRETADHFSRPKPQEWKDVGLARISYGERVVWCSCGWRYSHIREKVREDAVDRHLAKRHGGRGIRF